MFKKILTRLIIYVYMHIFHVYIYLNHWQPYRKIRRNYIFKYSKMPKMQTCNKIQCYPCNAWLIFVNNMFPLQTFGYFEYLKFESLSKNRRTRKRNHLPFHCQGCLLTPPWPLCILERGAGFPSSSQAFPVVYEYETWHHHCLALKNSTQCQ